MMIDDRPRRRGFFGTLWWLVDGSRRLVLNLLFLLIVGALLYAAFGGGAPKLQDKTVLVLDLAGPIVEQRSGSARDAALGQLQGEQVQQTRLRDVLAALDAAAKEPKITSVLLVLDELSGGGLTAQREVAAALQRFRASGKKVVAWGTAIDQRQYYLAAHADEVYLHPMGMIGITGYGRLRNYYRDALDRLGVSANVVRVGKYKNAAEPYFANAPSPETQEADAALYNALWALYTDGVEKARKLPPGTIARTIDALPGSLVAVGGDVARLMVESKLVDGLKTRDELRKLLIERGAEDDKSKSFRQIDLGGWLAHVKPRTDGDAVAVVVAEGEISDDVAPPGRIGGRSTAELIRRARDDEKVKAVVLRVNSPGGSALGSELVRRELELTRSAGKPVVVSMGDVAASGGYWISMAADEVIADPATITGSIGVFGLLPTAEGLMEKVSVNAAGPSTTWLTNAYDPRKPLDPRYAELVQSAIGRIYTDFTGKAAVARKTTPQKIDEVAQGRVWTGAQALGHGLVDRMGSFGDALAAARTRGKLPDDARIAYIEQQGGRLQQILGFFDSAIWQGAVRGAAQALGLPVAGTGVPPAAVREMQHELSWLAEATARGAPFATIVHCLCTPVH
jgi:protease IV